MTFYSRRSKDGWRMVLLRAGISRLTMRVGSNCAPACQIIEAPTYPDSDQERLEEINFLLEAIRQLEDQDEFSTVDGRWSVTTPLWIEKARLENILNPPVEIKPEPVPAESELLPLYPTQNRLLSLHPIRK